MHVTAEPLLVELPVGETATIAVSITNTSSMIDAYDVEVFGLDPAWVTVTPARLSLFPSEVGIVEVAVSLPPDVPAGGRTIAVNVRSENDRAEFSLAQVNLDVGTRHRTTLRVDPTLITGGRKAEFSLIVGNEGNSTVEERPQGEDPEDLLDMTFSPPIVVLPPGRREIVQADVRGGRPWFGQPKPRVITFSLGPGSPPAMATFVQRPRIGRWLLSLLGLVTAAAVFALVLSTVADRLVDESSVDPQVLDKALVQPADGASAGDATVTPSPVTGKVVVASTGRGIEGVTAELYRSTNGTVALKTAATDASGTYTFARVPQGRYRMKVSGAGFADQWYEAASTFADATDIDVGTEPTPPLKDIAIGGRPGSIEGSVVTDDPTGAVAQLVRRGVTDPTVQALVKEVTVSADGSFQFEDVPSPASYQLVVTKEGFANATRNIELAAAQQLEDVKVILQAGDGLAAGHVQSPGGPLGGVAVTATSGDLEFSTVSLTIDDVGAFTLRNLPTPAAYTVTFQHAGYQSATRTIDLQLNQPLTGIAVTLTPTTGSISGTVHDVNAPLGGVTVAISGPDQLAFTTTSASVGDVGRYGFENLPSPATYTLTFSKDGYVSQTLVEDLGAAGAPGPLTGADATLVVSTAVVSGTVFSAANQPFTGASVSLSDGSVTKQVTSANSPPGRFEFTGVKPGAYTLKATARGTSDAVRLVNVLPADVEDIAMMLQAQASLAGTVLRLDPETEQFVPFSGAVVRLYAVDAFPGAPSSALAATTAAADGTYSFPELEAPVDFVVAVYSAVTSSDPLDSVLVRSQQSAVTTVPTFQIQVVT
jgi:Carboxypeptidase regulatory-like domain